MTEKAEEAAFLPETNGKDKVEVKIQNGKHRTKDLEGQEEESGRRKWFSFCTWKCCGITTACIVALLLFILGMGYYRYVSRLTGKATSENSAAWEKKLTESAGNSKSQAAGRAGGDDDGSLSTMYVLVSFDPSYDDYLLAMGTPSFVLSLVKASKDVMILTTPADDELETGTWKWEKETGGCSRTREPITCIYLT